MLNETSRPFAASEDAADRPSVVAPETEIRVDERVKRPPSTAHLRPAPPPEVQDLVDSPEVANLEDVWQDERVGRPPPKHMLPAVIPPDIRALLGEAPLLPGEDRAAYEALLEQVAQARAPKDFVEWLNVKDIADFAWESERLKRLKARMLTQRVKEALCGHVENALEKKGEDPQACRRLAQRLSSGWACSDPTATEEILRLLPEGVDLALVTAEALLGQHEKFDVLDRMLTTAVKHRQRAAQDIETRRLLFVRTWRLEHVFPKTSWCM